MVKSLFDTQKKYINHFFESVDIEKTKEMIDALFSCKGNLVLTGIGKSGIIANKLAMTMLSTGTKAIYISPTDALHGDMGIVTKDDIVILISKSGETKELIDLIPSIKKKGAQIFSIVSKKKSTLSLLSHLDIILPVKNEICPFNLAPTTSTAIQLIFGDILAVELMRRKNFSLADYAINHPSGTIGKKITFRVEDLMVKGTDLPLCNPKDLLIDVLPILSEKKCGAILVVDETQNLLGIFTDGDLRRAIESKGKSFLSCTIEELMTRSPVVVSKEALAYDAMGLMEKDPLKLISVLPVVEENKNQTKAVFGLPKKALGLSEKVLGLLRMHDIIQLGLD